MRSEPVFADALGERVDVQRVVTPLDFRHARELATHCWMQGGPLAFQHPADGAARSTPSALTQRLVFAKYERSSVGIYTVW